MAKSKDTGALDREGSKSGRSDKSARAPDQPLGVPSASQEHSETYEACMKAYRWMSRRYRKTLDALAK